MCLYVFVICCKNKLFFFQYFILKLVYFKLPVHVPLSNVSEQESGSELLNLFQVFCRFIFLDIYLAYHFSLTIRKML